MPRLRFAFGPLIDSLRAESLRIGDKARRVRSKYFKFPARLLNDDNSYGKLRIVNVEMIIIKSFGLVHELILTKGGLPREFYLWGYINLTDNRSFRVSVQSVRELQKEMGRKRIKTIKEPISATLSTGRVLNTYDWHMFVKNYIASDNTKT